MPWAPSPRTAWPLWAVGFIGFFPARGEVVHFLFLFEVLEKA
jgi:hypothetical protein